MEKWGLLQFRLSLVRSFTSTFVPSAMTLDENERIICLSILIQSIVAHRTCHHCNKHILSLFECLHQPFPPDRDLFKNVSKSSRLIYISYPFSFEDIKPKCCIPLFGTRIGSLGNVISFSGWTSMKCALRFDLLAYVFPHSLHLTFSTFDWWMRRCRVKLYLRSNPLAQILHVCYWYNAINFIIFFISLNSPTNIHYLFHSYDFFLSEHNLISVAFSSKMMNKNSKTKTKLGKMKWLVKIVNTTMAW